MTDVSARMNWRTAAIGRRVRNLHNVRARRTARVRAWALIAAAIAALGIAGTVIAAVSIAHDDARQSRASFRGASGAIASRLKLALVHEEDLLLDGAAFIKEHPDAAPSVWWRWVADAQALARYPEVVGVGIVKRVPARRLPAWKASIARNPTSQGNRLPFTLRPPGERPYFCLSSATVTRVALTPGNDFCMADAKLAASAATGTPTAYALQLRGVGRWFGVAVPVYRTATPPATPTARRRDFIGWIGMAAVPDVLLRQALDARRNTRIILERGFGPGLAFGYGRAPAGAAREVVDLHDGSKVEILAAVSGSAILTNRNSRELLLGGILVSLLMAALAYALGTGRARALRLVDEKTSQLSFQALHDALTDLPNRVLVLDRAEQALTRARRSQQAVSALFIDVDGFKSVNDTFGHATGDQLLRVVSARLQGVVRAADTVGRLGGDEFVVLLEANDQYVAPEFVADRILEVLRQPVEIDREKTVTISASIGIASGSRDTADELLRDADLALYAAKAAGKNRYLFFEHSMQSDAADRYQLELDLQTALTGGELFLLYQPIYNLGSGAITGVEALLRWQHPTRGLVPPDQFIPVAEETSAIIEIGAWVLEQACAQLDAWHRSGHRIQMSVNVSACQVEDSGFVGTIEAALAKTGADPRWLTLEITETVLMHEADASLARLQALKRLGVRIAIDDFGTGYSSLAYLREFPVDAIKIDRSFISGISAAAQSDALIHTLVQLGKTLGLATLAEGIEDASQLERLRREQCDSGQGFLFARPMSAAAVEELLSGTAASASSTSAPFYR